ncbi:hypothetical protein NECAME_03465 [Necator americanus]|uniref:EamA domain-containing protein n=1 Tax=Necator americanus TaxID=51031 RepID=W2T3Q3_NECAM|nr:hypothetical protein NECAME_03465 [Necator americanus]ETN76533.1 hypothetical protein NECAME_03465 [Necator americanus]
MFSYGCGVLCTGIFIFLVYAIKRRNHPWISDVVPIPAFATGFINACGMTAFGVTIDKLNAAIAYPICQMAPGLVTALWSVLYFKEITVWTIFVIF